MSESEVTKDKVVGWIVAGLPYPDQCSDFDTTRDGSIYFTWRRDRFRISVPGLMVEQCEPVGFLTGSNLAICMSRLIKGAMIRDTIEGAKP